MTNNATSGAADLPEALRLADFLQGPFALDWTNEAAAELLRLHALTEQQQRELIKESHRTAEQKLRADQMTTQHAHQAALNTEARAQLAAALTAQAISKAPDHIPEVGNMVAQAISAEPAGAGYAALPDAKTLGEAVAAWIGVETRGAHKRVDTTVDRLGFAVRSVVGDMLRASNGQAPAGVLHLVQDAFAEIAMAFPKAFALHKVGIADTAACRDFGARDFGKDKTMTEPTDALELLREIYADLVQGAIPNADDHWWQKARAVLAKWGQPAQAAEPFCWQWENTFNGGTGAVKKNPETLGINMSHPDYKWTALYTAPQPAHAQAGAVPLTPEQAQDLIELESWGPDAIGLNAQLLRTIRRTEAAHGIKGGQHGTE